MNAVSDTIHEVDTHLVFQPDETLDMLGDMLARALAGAKNPDWRGRLWPALQELGLFAALMPERDGGYGGARTAALACRLLAQAGLVTPFAVSSAAIARTLGDLPQPGARVDALLQALGEGEGVATLALHEGDTLPAMRNLQSVLTPSDDGGYRLDAAKRMVAFAAEADWLLLPATMPGGETAIVVLGRPTVEPALQPCVLIDGTPAAHLNLAGHPVAAEDVLVAGGEADAALARMADALAAAQCAEAVGAMRAMIDATGEYLGVRRQFGQPLSANQALRHRFVDMEIALARAETMAAVAAAAVDGEAAGQRARIVAGARHVVLRSSWKVSQEALQMHGAIGMADETPLGGHFRRLLALALWFGDEDEALKAACA